MEKSTQYKGIFYNHKSSHKFYEGGAHFSYNSLVKILNEIKDKLNKNRDKENDSNLTLSNNEKDLEKKEEKIEIKKISIPLLNKQKNKSMTSLLNDNKIFTKIKNEKLQRSNNDKMRMILKEKGLVNGISSNSVKKINVSIYKNRNNINMPNIYNNQKNIKKNVSLGALNNKYKLAKMNSTICFNENNKCNNYYLLNNINNSRNKNILNPTNSISHSLNKNKYNINNNSFLSDRFKLINNYNKNLKLYNSKNNADYININNHYIKINKNRLNNTKINFSNERGLKGKYIDDKNRERMKMNMSVFNFSMLKKNN